jgi:MoaA/NifB/PqqE/SkfB family radical SAM enzyme
MRSNYHELAQLPDFAKEYKFDRLVITPVQDIFTEENIFIQKDSFIEESLKKAISVFSQKANEYNIVVLNWLPVNENTQTKNKYNKIISLSKRRKFLCYWPWQFMVIDQEGKVRPQCPCVKRVGDINENSLEDIWNNELMQFYRRKIIDNNYTDLCDTRCTSGIISEEDLGFH